MARLEISWKTRTDVSPKAAATGEATEGKGSSSMRSERPMMVYVTSEDESDTITNKLEQVVFKSEKLAIGAKFFDAIKMSPGDAQQDRLIADTGRKSPRMVFLTRDYKVHKVLQGKSISAGQMTKAMSSLVKKEYKDNFNKMTKEYAKLLNQLDRLEAKKQQLADMAQRLADKPNRGKQKKMERSKLEYEKDRKAWQEKHDALLSFKPKAGPKVKT